MTPEQLSTLKAALIADTAITDLKTAHDTQGIADYLCGDSTFIVTKTALSRHDILTGTSDEGTTFTWTGGAYITRSQGERDAFREIFNSTGTVNPTLPSIQAAFADIFSGTGGAVNRTHITAMSKRKATRLEKIFATGTGTLASPGTLVVEGGVDEFTIRVLAWSNTGEWLL